MGPAEPDTCCNSEAGIQGDEERNNEKPIVSDMLQFSQAQEDVGLGHQEDGAPLTPRAREISPGFGFKLPCSYFKGIFHITASVQGPSI